MPLDEKQRGIVIIVLKALKGIEKALQEILKESSTREMVK